MKCIRCYRLAVFLFLCLALGCGGSNNGSLMGFQSGLHSTVAQSAADPSVANFVLAGSLEQNGSSLSGVVHLQGSPCFPPSTDIPVSGTVGETAANFTAMLPNGQQVSFTGMMHPPVPHPQFLGGNYSVTGSGCLPNLQGLASDEANNFSGTYTGTFSPSTGGSASITLTLNQTGPDAHGFFSATGTATITGGTCFSSATIDPATVLLGNGSTLILDDAAAGSTGQTVANGQFVASSNVGAGFFGGSFSSAKGGCSETGALNMEL